MVDMAEVLRSELKGSESPGGTKTFELDVNFAGGSSKSKLQRQLEREQQDALAEDAIIDAARRDAGLDDLEAEDAELAAMRQRFQKAQKGQAAGQRGDERAPATKSEAPTAPPGMRAPSGGEKFQGDFSWDNFDQVKQLSETNAALLQQLDQKEREMNTLKANVAANSQVTGFNPEKFRGVKDEDGNFLDANEGFKDAKILDLAKRNRQLNVALQKEKSTIGRLAKEVERLQVERAKAQSDRAEGKRPNPKASAGGKTGDEREAAAALAAAEAEIRKGRRRMESLRISRDKAKEDVRRVVNVLRKEVGDNCDIESVLNGESPDGGVRGRSQQIVMLRTKCKRMEHEIKKLRTGEAGSEVHRGGRNSRMSNASSTKRFDVDQKALESIQNIERSKAQAAETVTRELGEMRQIAILQKEKLDAQRARMGTLQKENKKMRGEVKLLLNKTGTDDKLIDALKEEVAQSRAAVNEMSRRLESIKMHGGMNEAEWTQLKASNKQQRDQLERQEEMITTLRAELDQMQQNASSDLVQRAEQDMSIHNKNVDINLLRIENERVTELAEMFKNKFQNEQKKNVAGESKIRSLESRCVDLERRLGNINAGGLKRQPPADQFQQLKDKLALQIEENLALKKSFRTGLATKDEELRILRTLTEQQQSAYEKALKEMKRQVKQTAGQAQAKVIQTESKNDAKIMSQLQADNDYLRKEMSALKKKLRQVELMKRVRPMHK